MLMEYLNANRILASNKFGKNLILHPRGMNGDWERIFAAESAGFPTTYYP